jgi:glycosyltransferase involved in cell wall biosynthesis
MEPIAESLHRRFGRRVRFDVVGVAHRERLPRRFRRVVPDRGAARAAYPAFVEWLCRQEWDLAVSPLIDSPFNRCKSAIKLLDYAALGLPVIASAHAEYDATFGVGTGVQLVANSPEAWVEALSRLIVDPEARRREGAQILRHYRDHHVLCRHPDHIWAPLRRTVSRTSPGRPAPAA